jgi:hypothetical protein
MDAAELRHQTLGSFPPYFLSVYVD